MSSPLLSKKTVDVDGKELSNNGTLKAGYDGIGDDGNDKGECISTSGWFTDYVDAVEER